MRKIKYIVLAFLSIVGFVSCQDDLEIIGKVDLNRPATINLSFGVPSSDKIQISRAEGDESIEIKAIRLYLFSGDSFLKSEDITELTSVGDEYTATVTLYSGTQTIYAVANPESPYWENPLEDLDAAASEGKDKFLSTLYSLNTLLTDVGDPTLPSLSYADIPLTGIQDITVESGQIVNSNTIKLQRPYAQILFNITTELTKDGKSITFVPQTYTVENVPKSSYAWIGDDSREDITDLTKFYTPHTDNIGTAEENIASFSFYMPENVQSCKRSCENDFNKRDYFPANEASEKKNWTYAPDCGTYVVIKGQYKETDIKTGVTNRYADVSYTIHLGDFSEKTGDMSNFSVLRNYIYTYRMTVEGVNEIKVEAEAESDQGEQPGAEGDVVDLDKHSKAFSLDSHYEQVYVEYDLTEIVNRLPKGLSGNDLDKEIKKNFLLSIHSPMNATDKKNNVIYPYASEHDEETDMKGIDHEWVKFYSQRERSVITSYSDVEDKKLLSPWIVCNKLGALVKGIYEGAITEAGESDGLYIVRKGENLVAPFTIFVDEYVYSTDLKGNIVGWDAYTRQDPRTISIASDMQVSGDKNSTYSKALTYITQTSIETFYNPLSASNTNALGIETYNENGLIRGIEDGDTKIIGFGTPEAVGNEPSNGRANMLTNMGNKLSWGDFIDFTKVGYLDDNTSKGNVIKGIGNFNNAYYACLSRNRDLNHNKKIDPEEVKWYLPAITQYLRMGIGAQSLSNEARMYTGSKGELDDGAYPGDFLDKGALYYTNTGAGGNGDSFNIGENFYWAVEVGAYGSTNGTRAQIRCVRNLAKKSLVSKDGNPVGNEALAEAVYGKGPIKTDGNYIFNFGERLDASLFRYEPQTTPYVPHDEDNEKVNKLPHAFVVAKDYIKDRRGNLQSFDYRTVWYGSSQQDPCYTYSEEWDKGDKGIWRTPNLNELMVMATWPEILMSGKNTYSRTRFSNQDVRHGFYYNISGFITTNDGGINDGGYIRCVRDADASEVSLSRMN